MNYKQSSLILKEIKKSKKVLINCHEHPDADSVSSALALKKALSKMDISADVVCPSTLDNELKTIIGAADIETVNFSKIDYSGYNLFFIIDTSDWKKASGNDDIPFPPIPVIDIDHHKANSGFGMINLVDYKRTSLAELLYFVFQDWSIKIDETIAQYLLTGIIGDTGSFRFETSAETLEIAAKLIRLGADKNKIVFNLYRNMELDNLKLLGELLLNIKHDEKNKFIWTALPFNKINKFSDKMNLDAIDILLQSIENTNFGIRMIEKKKNELNVSLRARTRFDSSKIALELGGGGHPVASGAKVIGKEFDDAVALVLKTAKKYSK